MTNSELEMLSTKIAEKMHNNNKIWMDPKDLQARDGISTARQANLRSQRKIPFHKRGRYIRYKTADIDQWFEDAKVV